MKIVNTLIIPIFSGLFCVAPNYSNAQTPEDETVYQIHSWSAGLHKDDPYGASDKAYKALETAHKSLAKSLPTGKREFYYQIVFRNNGFTLGPCNKLEGKRLINGVVATISRQDAANGTEVQNLPLLLYGVGYDPGSQSRLDHDERHNCNVVPVETQLGKLARYEGSSPDAASEKYRGSLRFAYATEKNNDFNTVLNILKAIANIQTIKDKIPPGYEAAVDGVHKTILAAAGPDKTTVRTTFRNFTISPAEGLPPKNAVHKLIINGAEDRGSIEIYVRRQGSLVLHKATIPGDIITESLRTEDEKFKDKFWESAKPKSDTKAQPSENKEDRLSEADLDTTKLELKSAKDTDQYKKGRSFVRRFCKKIVDVAKNQLRLTDLDNALMRRSMLVEYELADVISGDTELGTSCWTQDDEYLVQEVLVPAFTSKLEVFGSYKSKKLAQ